MGTMTIRVINRSTHEFTCTGSWGSEISCSKDLSIPGNGKSTDIGTIGIPHMLKNRDGNWGWWYIEDSTNSATFEFFACAHPEKHSGDEAHAGLLANGSHKRDHPLGPTPNPLPRYLDTARDDTSFTLIIKEEWTSSPPDWIFNYGHYFLDLPLRDSAAHAYVQAVSFKDRKKTVDFECYGGTSGRENRYSALSFIASEDQFRLARTICCFDPDDKRSSYGRKPNLSSSKPSGPLLLGDCNRIIYLHSIVCHRMANRICAAVTDLDVGDLADMALYNLTHQFWDAYGKPPPPAGPKEVWNAIYEAFKSQAALTNEQLQALGVYRGASESADRLFRPWHAYFAECKKRAEGHKA